MKIAIYSLETMLTEAVSGSRYVQLNLHICAADVLASVCCIYILSNCAIQQNLSYYEVATSADI